MQTINIKICTNNQKSSPHQFFILSKGNNAGRPMTEPCANCFVVTCENENKCQMLYWLCYSLWQSGTFRQYLVGSVIEFLHVNETRRLLYQAYHSAQVNPEAYTTFSQMLQRLLNYELTLTDQLEKVRKLKSSIAINVLKTLPSEDISPLRQR